MVTFLCLFEFFVFAFPFVYAVPPEACFANFRGEDCGQPPKAVMYYYKPGSRCEVGIWRGCLPNPNMFADEYECVDTCIFITSGSNMDALDMLNNKISEEDQGTTTVDSGNGTTVSDDDNATTSDGSDSTGNGAADDGTTADGEGGGGATGQEDDSTADAAGGDGEATTAAEAEAPPTEK